MEAMQIQCQIDLLRAMKSMKAWDKAKDGGADMSKIYYFDANIECEGTKCKIEVNEPLD